MFFVLIIKQEIGLIEDSNQSVEMSKLEALTSWKIEVFKNVLNKVFVIFPRLSTYPVVQNTKLNQFTTMNQ